MGSLESNWDFWFVAVMVENLDRDGGVIFLAGEAGRRVQKMYPGCLRSCLLGTFAYLPKKSPAPFHYCRLPATDGFALCEVLEIRGFFARR
jgi:hypothetical protein